MDRAQYFTWYWSDGSKRESSGTTLFHYAGGLAFAVGTGLAESAPIESTLRYEDANGETIFVRDTGIKRIIFDDPARVAEELMKDQRQKEEQARQHAGWMGICRKLPLEDQGWIGNQLRPRS